MRRSTTSHIRDYGSALLVASVSVIAVGWGSCPSLLAADTPQANAAPVTKADVIAAWEKRSRAVRSARFEFVQTRLIRRGKFLSANDPDTGNKRPVPETDTTYEYRQSLVFDGARTRFESQGPAWHYRKLQFTEQREVGVWDGHSAKIFRPDEAYPRGEILLGNMHLNQPYLRPFALAFRTLEPQWRAIDPQDFVLTEKTAVVEGRRCLILETSPRKLAELAQRRRRPIREALWTAPDLGFAVVRYEMAFPESITNETAISYRQDQTHGWYPARWTITEYAGPGEVSEVYEGRITDYALNLPVPEATFQYEFPAGAWVSDYREDKRNETYLVGEGGERRIVTEAELRRGAGYEDLLATPSGMAGLRPIAHGGSRWLTWIVAAVVLLGAVVCVVVLWRRARRHE